MKTVLGFILLAILGFAFASQSPTEIEAELLSYAQSQVDSILRHPVLGRSGGGLACYDKYIPLISAATSNSKTETETCNNLATTRRQDELNKVKDQRAALDTQVETVQNTLSGCAKQEEALEFLKCLKDSSSILQSTIEQVTLTSKSLADGLADAYATIDNSENLCIQRVLDKVKTETNTLTSALQSCLMNGFDEPQPESTSSATASPVESSTTSTTTTALTPESSEAIDINSSEGTSSTSPSYVISESSSSSSAIGEVTPNYNQLPEEQL